MMNKEDCVAMLLDMGYLATLESGVVIIIVESESALKKANKAIRSIGYDASWGTRMVRKDAGRK